LLELSRISWTPSEEGFSADPLAVHAPGKADLNLYAYVSGRVLKATDPLGLFAEINRRGNVVTIDIPIVFQNESSLKSEQADEVVEKYIRSIEKTWSGKFGNLKVTTHVRRLDEKQARDVARQGRGLNIIKLQESRDASADAGHASKWAVKPHEHEYAGTSEEGHGDILVDAKPRTAAHEAGHLLGLDHGTAGNDKVLPGGHARGKDPNNIMTPIAEGGTDDARPSSEQIKFIVDNYCNHGCSPAKTGAAHPSIHPSIAPKDVAKK
jgi:hypothetical protein